MDDYEKKHDEAEPYAWVSAWADGEMKPAEAAEAEKRLAEDAGAKKALEAVRRAGKLVTVLKQVETPEPDSALDDKLVAAMQNALSLEENRTVGKKNSVDLSAAYRPLFSGHSFFFAAAAAAVLLVVFGIGYFFVKRTGAERTLAENTIAPARSENGLRSKVSPSEKAAKPGVCTVSSEGFNPDTSPEMPPLDDFGTGEGAELRGGSHATKNLDFNGVGAGGGKKEPAEGVSKREVAVIHKSLSAARTPQAPAARPENMLESQTRRRAYAADKIAGEAEEEKSPSPSAPPASGREVEKNAAHSAMLSLDRDVHPIPDGATTYKAKAERMEDDAAEDAAVAAEIKEAGDGLTAKGTLRGAEMGAAAKALADEAKNEKQAAAGADVSKEASGGKLLAYLSPEGAGLSAAARKIPDAFRKRGIKAELVSVISADTGFYRVVVKLPRGGVAELPEALTESGFIVPVGELKKFIAPLEEAAVKKETVESEGVRAVSGRESAKATEKPAPRPKSSPAEPPADAAGILRKAPVKTETPGSTQTAVNAADIAPAAPSEEIVSITIIIPVSNR